MYDQQQLEGARNALRGDAILDSHVHPVVVDVTKKEALEQVRERISRDIADTKGCEVSALVAVVNNAAVVYAGPLETVPIDKVRASMEVLAIGPVLVCQVMLPLLRQAKELCKGAQRQGFSPRIINISSGAGVLPIPIHGPYTMGKTALEAASDIFRQELQEQGISVCIIQPGMVRTDAALRFETIVNTLWNDRAETYYKPLRNRAVAQANELLQDENCLRPSEVGSNIAFAVSSVSIPSRLRVGASMQGVVFLPLLPTWVTDKITRILQIQSLRNIENQTQRHS